MDIQIIAALIALGGVIVGAIAQYAFSQRTEASKQYQQLKSQAYTDFIKATAGLAISQRNHLADKELEFTILAADSKARIAVFGDKEVVKSMAKFFQEFGSLDSPKAITSFVSIVHKMRNDSLKQNQEVMNKEISLLLFGPD